MSRRSKRLRDLHEEEAGPVYSPPAVADRVSLLERLDNASFSHLLSFLELPELVTLQRTNRFLRHRVISWKPLSGVKRRFAAEHRGWTYANMGDEAALKRIEQLLSKGENCLACGERCKGVKWPREFRQKKELKLLSEMCIDCFLAKNKGVKLVKASAADSKYGLSVKLRQDLPYVIWNRGYRSVRHMYLDSDLQKVAAKIKKTKK